MLKKLKWAQLTNDKLLQNKTQINYFIAEQNDTRGPSKCPQATSKMTSRDSQSDPSLYQSVPQSTFKICPEYSLSDPRGTRKVTQGYNKKNPKGTLKVSQHYPPSSSKHTS